MSYFLYFQRIYENKFGHEFRDSTDSTFNLGEKVWFSGLLKRLNELTIMHYCLIARREIRCTVSTAVNY